MPECRNCGSHVTDDYVRVFSIDDRPGIAVCPECPDKIRDTDGTVRDARSPRQSGGNGPSTYDEDYSGNE